MSSNSCLVIVNNISRNQVDDFPKFMLQGFEKLSEIFPNIVPAVTNCSKVEWDNQTNKIDFNDEESDVSLQIIVQPLYKQLKEEIINLAENKTIKDKYIVYVGSHGTGCSSDWLLMDATFSANLMLTILKESSWHEDDSVELMPINILTPGNSAHWNKILSAVKVKETKQNRIRVFSFPTEVPDKEDASLDKDLELFCQILHEKYHQLLFHDNSLTCCESVGTLQLNNKRGSLYIFDESSGMSSLLALNGFNMVIDTGYKRQPEFWNFLQKLEKIDTCIMTSWNETNLFGMESLLNLKSKALQSNEVSGPNISYCILPIGPNPSKEKDLRPKSALEISIEVETHRIIHQIKELEIPYLQLSRDAKQINSHQLYFKLGQGCLDAFPLWPCSSETSGDSKRYVDEWQKDSKNQSIHFDELVKDNSSAFMLIWNGSKVTLESQNDDIDFITRILVSSSCHESHLLKSLEEFSKINAYCSSFSGKLEKKTVDKKSNAVSNNAKDTKIVHDKKDNAKDTKIVHDKKDNTKDSKIAQDKKDIRKSATADKSKEAVKSDSNVKSSDKKPQVALDKQIKNHSSDSAKISDKKDTTKTSVSEKPKHLEQKAPSAKPLPKSLEPKKSGNEKSVETPDSKKLVKKSATPEKQSENTDAKKPLKKPLAKDTNLDASESKKPAKKPLLNEKNPVVIDNKKLTKKPLLNDKSSEASEDKKAMKKPATSEKLSEKVDVKKTLNKPLSAEKSAPIENKKLVKKPVTNEKQVETKKVTKEESSDSKKLAKKPLEKPTEKLISNKKPTPVKSEAEKKKTKESKPIQTSDNKVKLPSADIKKEDAKILADTTVIKMDIESDFEKIDIVGQPSISLNTDDTLNNIDTSELLGKMEEIGNNSNQVEEQLLITGERFDLQSTPLSDMITDSPEHPKTEEDVEALKTDALSIDQDLLMTNEELPEDDKVTASINEDLIENENIENEEMPNVNISAKDVEHFEDDQTRDLELEDNHLTQFGKYSDEEYKDENNLELNTTEDFNVHEASQPEITEENNLKDNAFIDLTDEMSEQRLPRDSEFSTNDLENEKVDNNKIIESEEIDEIPQNDVQVQMIVKDDSNLHSGEIFQENDADFSQDSVESDLKVPEVVKCAIYGEKPNEEIDDIQFPVEKEVEERTQESQEFEHQAESVDQKQSDIDDVEEKEIHESIFDENMEEKNLETEYFQNSEIKVNESEFDLPDEAILKENDSLEIEKSEELISEYKDNNEKMDDAVQDSDEFVKEKQTLQASHDIKVDYTTEYCSEDLIEAANKQFEESALYSDKEEKTGDIGTFVNDKVEDVHDNVNNKTDEILSYSDDKEDYDCEDEIKINEYKPHPNEDEEMDKINYHDEVMGVEGNISHLDEEIETSNERKEYDIDNTKDDVNYLEEVDSEKVELADEIENMIVESKDMEEKSVPEADVNYLHDDLIENEDEQFNRRDIQEIKHVDEQREVEEFKMHSDEELMNDNVENVELYDKPVDNLYSNDDANEDNQFLEEQEEEEISHEHVNKEMESKEFELHSNEEETKEIEHFDKEDVHDIHDDANMDKEESEKEDEDDVDEVEHVDTIENEDFVDEQMREDETNILDEEDLSANIEHEEIQANNEGKLFRDTYMEKEEPLNPDEEMKKDDFLDLEKDREENSLNYPNEDFEQFEVKVDDDDDDDDEVESVKFEKNIELPDEQDSFPINVKVEESENVSDNELEKDNFDNNYRTLSDEHNDFSEIQEKQDISHEEDEREIQLNDISENEDKHNYEMEEKYSRNENIELMSSDDIKNEETKETLELKGTDEGLLCHTGNDDINEEYQDETDNLNDPNEIIDNVHNIEEVPQENHNFKNEFSISNFLLNNDKRSKNDVDLLLNEPSIMDYSANISQGNSINSENHQECDKFLPDSESNDSDLSVDIVKDHTTEIEKETSPDNFHQPILDDIMEDFSPSSPLNEKSDLTISMQKPEADLQMSEDNSFDQPFFDKNPSPSGVNITPDIIRGLKYHNLSEPTEIEVEQTVEDEEIINYQITNVSEPYTKKSEESDLYSKHRDSPSPVEKADSDSERFGFIAQSKPDDYSDSIPNKVDHENAVGYVNGSHFDEHLTESDPLSHWNEPLGLPMPSLTATKTTMKSLSDKHCSPLAASKLKSAQTSAKVNGTSSNSAAPVVHKATDSPKGVTSPRGSIHPKPSTPKSAPVTKSAAATPKQTKKPEVVDHSKLPAFYMEVAYIPVDHDGNVNPERVTEAFFIRVRAKEYILPGLEHSSQVLDSMLAAKEKWSDDDKSVEVRLIPVKLTDTLRKWAGQHAQELSQLNIKIGAAVEHCSVSLGGDQSSPCIAHRIDF